MLTGRIIKAFACFCTADVLERLHDSKCYEMLLSIKPITTTQLHRREMFHQEVP